MGKETSVNISEKDFNERDVFFNCFRSPELLMWFYPALRLLRHKVTRNFTIQKINNFFSKCDQIRSHLLQNISMENLNFFAVFTGNSVLKYFRFFSDLLGGTNKQKTRIKM